MSDLLNLIDKLEKAEAGSRELIDKLLANVQAEGDCIVWCGSADRRGRGRIRWNKKMWLAHRAVWVALNGPIKHGAMLCHHCDVAGCVNPDHMYEGDHQSNMRDMKNRKRYWQAREPERVSELAKETFSAQTHTRGEGNPKNKLTSDQVDEIRSSGAGTKDLSSKYGVHRTTIQRIRNGALWNS